VSNLYNSTLEVIRFGEERQGFVVVVEFLVMFRFLVVEVEGCQHCGAKF